MNNREIRVPGVLVEPGDLACAEKVSASVYSRFAYRNRYESFHSEDMWTISLGKKAGVWGVSCDGRIICVKIFYNESFFNRIRRCLGFDKARRAYLNARRLKEIGVNVPRALAFFPGTYRNPSLLLTEFISGKCILEWLEAGNYPDYTMITRLASFIAGTHRVGVSHDDLSGRNIIMEMKGNEYRFLFLDYEDTHFHTGFLPKEIAFDNLHHLHERVIKFISVKDRIRFLKAYAGEGGHPFTPRSFFDYIRKHPSKYLNS